MQAKLRAVKHLLVATMVNGKWAAFTHRVFQLLHVMPKHLTMASHSPIHSRTQSLIHTPIGAAIAALVAGIGVASCPPGCMKEINIFDSRHRGFASNCLEL